MLGDSGISYEWVSPNERRERIDQLEERIGRPAGQFEEAIVDFEAPHFTENLTDIGEYVETEAATFMCVLEPIGDSQLRTTWLHNGHTIPFSNRIQLGNDFGVHTLTIKHLIAQDSGLFLLLFF